ncbi:thioesterase II family protein [Streptomyces sp. SD31]|uniref:thioesterase II family protein n=1 Tax=Streptomyces sp. SD31 TaxID=3452208 RepID=UPI003F8AAF0B
MRCFHPLGEARARLVCFPHAGGSASAYHLLSAGLAEDGVQTLAVQYPGRQDRHREACVERVDDLVDAVLRELAPELGDGLPVGLLGHSMGAVLAFEVARRLEEDGRGPVVLFASGRQAPSLPWPAPGTPSLGDADDALLVSELRLLSGGDARVLEHPGLLRLALPALRADYRMLENYAYVPGPKLGCPIVALAGDRDPRVAVGSVALWEQETRAGFELRVLPGGHFFIDEQLSEVLTVISSRL